MPSPQRLPTRSVDEQISAITGQTPNRVALVGNGETATFAELETQTSNFAGNLATRGIGRGDVIAIRVHSRIEIVPLIRAILRLGAIFTPLDLDHPEDRIDYVLKDADAKLLITTQGLTPRDLGIPVLSVESLAAFQSLVPPTAVPLDHPASILFTSGSTGQPKGVLRLHRGVVSRLTWAPWEPDDVFCHNMSLCYGFSQERIFLPLMLGLPLVILPDSCHRDPKQFAKAVDQNRITQITVVPAFLDQLIEPKHRLYEHLRSVRTVIVGSAFLSPDTIEQFHTVLPRARLINVYGATEMGTLCWGEMSPGDEPSVGTPTPGMEAFVLDEHLEPIPAGEVGEVFGGGPSLAAGYWRRPPLTAERFIANPFGSEPPVLYRTRDRGRLLPDGRIQLVGRADRQVKVRGHRVELVEVEQALLRMPQIAEAAVVSQPIGFDNRLIAYVSPREGEALSASMLRHHLRDLVPNYMLPSAYSILPCLPRTSIGKIDASALPSPGLSRSELGNPYVPPATPLENEIADVWAEILEKDCVGRHDHFLDLGGDSIIAVQLAAALDRFGAQIDVVSVFELPTVAEMAPWLESQLAKRDVL